MSRMSLLRTKPSSTSLKEVVTKLDTMLAGSSKARMQGINIASMESISDPVQLSSMRDQATDFDHGIMSAFGFEDITGAQAGKVTHAQRDAAAIVAMAYADPKAYVRSGYASTNGIGAEGAQALIEPTMIGAGGEMDYRSEAAVSVEAFEENELRNHMPFSIAFNFSAARQDDFSEAFYPTLVVTPDQAGLDIGVRRPVVFNSVRHNADGRTAEFNRKNLINAFVDASILENESTYLYPVATADSADKFVADGLIGSASVSVENVDFPTAPLKANIDIDLIGISSHPGLIESGVMNETDSIDARIALKTAYFALGTGADARAIAFKTLRLPRSGFNKTPEGEGREMGLQFTTKDLLIDSSTRAVDGSEIAALAAIAENDFTVRLAQRISGTANLETGNVGVYGSGNAAVVAIIDADGTAIDLTSGVGAAIVASLSTLTFVGYDLEARRTNANKRTRGMLVDSLEYVERYTIPLGSPISTPAPIASTRDSADMANLITAARIRNSNNAVTSLLNYAEALDSYVRAGANEHVPAIEGIGRFLVKPWYQRTEIDVLNSINSLSSASRAEDLRATIINTVRSMAYAALRDSQYQAALDVLTGGQSVTPSLVIGTDPVIAQHLMVSGDSRTLGILMDHKVVTSIDSRIRGKIFFSFVRNDVSGEPDPLSFGIHAWIPELTSTVQMHRNGATFKETMVQPRSRHIQLLPILGEIDIVNLEEGLRDKATVNVNVVNTVETNEVGGDVVEEPAP